MGKIQSVSFELEINILSEHSSPQQALSLPPLPYCSLLKEQRVMGHGPYGVWKLMKIIRLYSVSLGRWDCGGSRHLLRAPNPHCSRSLQVPLCLPVRKVKVAQYFYPLCSFNNKKKEVGCVCVHSIFSITSISQLTKI
jgi:hypothetical protein